MLERFLPREESFFDFFDKHAALIVQASKEFLEIISHDTFDLAQRNNHIKALEHQADEVVHQCLDALHKIFITPIDRDHIYHLVSSMDDIIDAINTAYNLLVIYRLTSPTPELQSLARVVLLSTQKVEQVVKGLRNMKNGEMISTICVEIHRLENEADDLLHESIARLFDEQSDALYVIKWKEIYESLEEATDFCEDVADAVQSIILESV